MRVLTVSHFFEAHGGGIERVAARLCRQFVQLGHEAVWAASASELPPQNAVKALPLHCINPTEALTGLPMPVPSPRSIMALARAVRNSDAVIVHDSLYITSILAMLLAKVSRKPVVLVQHIAGINFANVVMRGAMILANYLVTKPMLRAADHLVFISDAVRRELLGESSDLPSVVLFNGVDTAIFHPRDSSGRSATRLAYGLPCDVPLAIFVGRFVEKKGLSILKAVARLRPDLHFAIVGAGPIDPTTWHLPNVHVLGQQDQHRIADLYGAADMLLLPSVGEGYPLVIQEAMACGLPIVCGAETARADPGASHWLRGVPVELNRINDSATRFSAAIDLLKIENKDRLAMSHYARCNYSWEKMASDMISILETTNYR